MTKTEKSMNASKLRDLILNAQDLPVQPVVVPEWGGITVYVKSMTAKQRDDWQAKQFIMKDGHAQQLNMQNLSASLLVRTVYADPEGTVPIFTEDDVEALGNKSAAAINRLQDSIRVASGTTEKDQEALLKNLKDQEDISG